MFSFTKLENAARFALRANKIGLVFDGPDGGFAVAFGREAGELRAAGLVAYPLRDLALPAASGDEGREEHR
jgi:hypothetical protein